MLIAASAPQALRPLPGIREDPKAAARFYGSLESGDLELEPLFAHVGVQIATGMFYGGAAYLVIGVLSHEENLSFRGFLIATLGGGFSAGTAALGGGRYLYTFAANNLAMVSQAAAAWLDHHYPENTDDGSNNR
ncbi:hypothetical protein [Thermaurantiacus sp.]